MTKQISITVGALLRGRFRKMLKESKFLGIDLEYIEHKRFLQSDFLVKGNVEHIELIIDMIPKD